MRQRTGTIIERKRQVKDKRTGELKERVRLFAGVTFTGPDGKRHAKWRRAENRTHARELIKQLIGDLATHGTTAAMHERHTFRELVDWFEPRYVRAAVFHHGRKVSGLRSTSAGGGSSNKVASICALRSRSLLTAARLCAAAAAAC